MNQKTNLSVLINLCVMMFMQYLMSAVWWMQFSAFLANKSITGFEQAALLSSMAVGSMAAPMIGALADRYFPAEKLLAVLNLLTGVFLGAAALYVDNFSVFFVMIYLSMICYMPTWSLTSSIAMTHSPRELFPRIRMFGSIGWIASGLFSLIAIEFMGMETFDGTLTPMICGAIIALITAVSNLTLPSTPPMGKGKLSVGDLLGFRAFTLLKDKNFAVFTICSFFAIIAFAMYQSYGSLFFQDREFKLITVTMNFGQVAELFFLMITTVIITKAGFKWALSLGLIAMAARYMAFYFGFVMDVQAYYIVAVLFHGLIFGLFFVGGQVYTDQKAPAELRAQAQGMLWFIIWGVGLLIGNFVCGQLIESNHTAEGYGWDVIYLGATSISIVSLVLFLLFFKTEEVKA